MCSVVGYIGEQQSLNFVMEGLRRLEYRGYDSAGFACLGDQGHLLYAKSPGKLCNLVEDLKKEPINGTVGIGHTRWSTHGSSTVENAHPHFDCDKKLALVHNGIIENYQQLRDDLLLEGHVFHSKTDTEVVAHLLESIQKNVRDLNTVAKLLVSKLEGAYALVAIFEDNPDTMLLVRKRSPLCVGLSEGQMFVASDMLAFADRTDNVLFLPDESFTLVQKNSVSVFNFDGDTIEVAPVRLSVECPTLEKDEHEHYMLKEIYEQKGAIHDTVDFLQTISDDVWDHIGIDVDIIGRLDRINIVGCGTSWHAGRIAQFFFESIPLMPTRVHLASEFRYMPFFPEPNSLYIGISQSGETADTLEALRVINGMDQKTLALTNVSSSTMVREADGFLITQAGREVAVASTKAFTTQIAALYWLANRIAAERRIITRQMLQRAEKDLLVAAEVLENSIENYKLKIVQTLAEQYAAYKQVIFLGRHISYPLAMEAALKLKELAYIFSQCYPAGELKHGPLALVDNQIPVYLFSHQDQLIYHKILSNAQEVKARGGHLVSFAFEGQSELISLSDTAFVIPRVNPLLGSIAMAGIMQFFVYSVAKQLGCPIDKPRNLAKSVTVE